ncbi:MAG: hypothetical protein QOE92_207 [Chloroflexota bacterium]|nr:hypothetical protein [Chloroflexota bacterium]
MTLFLPPVRDEDRIQVRRVGQMLYTPGIVPRWGEEVRYSGAVDGDVSVRTAARAAQLCVHNVLALVRAERGSLDRVQQVMQLNVLVRCSDGFENISRVADGASEALYQVFGSLGRHHRQVLPTDDLPFGASVQVSGVFRIS